MEDWQQRVVDEKAQLDGRIERLEVALANGKAQIPANQRDLMIGQLGYMRAYSYALRDRIELFGSL